MEQSVVLRSEAPVNVGDNYNRPKVHHTLYILSSVVKDWDDSKINMLPHYMATYS